MINNTIGLALQYQFNHQTIYYQIIEAQLLTLKATLGYRIASQLVRNHNLKLMAQKHELQHKKKTHGQVGINKNIEIVKPQQPVAFEPFPLRTKKKFECKIETKNLPKNFGKAIITYIQNNQQQISKVLGKQGVQYKNFLALLMEKRPYINTIMSLQELWVQNFKYGKQMRSISIFKYFFNSRVRNLRGHIKYRQRLMEALKQPQQFTCLKTLKYKWTRKNAKKLKRQRLHDQLRIRKTKRIM